MRRCRGREWASRATLEPAALVTEPPDCGPQGADLSRLLLNDGEQALDDLPCSRILDGAEIKSSSIELDTFHLQTMTAVISGSTVGGKSDVLSQIVERIFQILH